MTRRCYWSWITDQPMAPWGRDTEHRHLHNSLNTIKVKFLSQTISKLERTLRILVQNEDPNQKLHPTYNGSSNIPWINNNRITPLEWTAVMANGGWGCFILCLLVSSTDNLCKQIGPRSGWTKCQAYLDPNCLTLWWYSWKNFSKKLIL